MLAAFTTLHAIYMPGIPPHQPIPNEPVHGYLTTLARNHSLKPDSLRRAWRKKQAQNQHRSNKRKQPAALRRKRKLRDDASPRPGGPRTVIEFKGAELYKTDTGFVSASAGKAERYWEYFGECCDALPARLQPLRMISDRVVQHKRAQTAAVFKSRVAWVNCKIQEEALSLMGGGQTITMQQVQALIQKHEKASDIPPFFTGRRMRKMILQYARNPQLGIIPVASRGRQTVGARKQRHILAAAANYVEMMQLSGNSLTTNKLKRKLVRAFKSANLPCKDEWALLRKFQKAYPRHFVRDKMMYIREKRRALWQTIDNFKRFHEGYV
jgi:hypothetical protein